MVFFRYMFYYLSMKHAEGIVNESIISKCSVFDRATIIYGVKEFPYILKSFKYVQKAYCEIEKEILKDSKSFVFEFEEQELDFIKLKIKYKKSKEYNKIYRKKINYLESKIRRIEKSCWCKIIKIIFVYLNPC